MTSPSGRYVFISYSNADIAWCQTFFNDLTRRLGKRVFLSANINPVAVEFEPFMWQIFTESYAILAVISPNSAQSAWVRREMVEAFKRKARDSSLLIVPVLIGDKASAQAAVSHIHPDLGRYHFADFTFGANANDTRARLLYALKHPERAVRPFKDGGEFKPMDDLRPWWRKTLNWMGQWALWFGGVKPS